MVVVGVLGEIGTNPMGRDQDDIILVPVTTAQRRLFSSSRSGSVSTIMVKARSSELLNAAQDQVESLLRMRHRVRKGEEDDFSVRNMAQMVENAKAATRTMTMLLTAVAGVSFSWAG